MKIRYLFLFCFLMIFSKAQTQITWDTTAELSRHEGGYGKFKPSMKVAVTYSDFMGLELARVRNKLSLVWLMNNTSTKYYGVQWSANPNYKAGLFGLKGGGDIDFRYLHLGCGLVAQTNFEKIKLSLVPDIGLSLWGTVGIYYGTILLLSEEDFIGNNNYQLGLKYNFTKDLLKEFKSGI